MFLWYWNEPFEVFGFLSLYLSISFALCSSSKEAACRFFSEAPHATNVEWGEEGSMKE